MLMRALVPIWIVADTTIDDQLFVRLSNNLSTGHWLGAYSRYTLVKGPAFPTFLAVVERLHLPPLLALQALHVGASALAGWAVARATGRMWWGFAAFAAVALDPSYYGAESSRLLRDGFYGTTTLLLLTVLLGAALTVQTRHRARYVIGWGLLGGLALAVYWLTREEHVWLVPSLGLLSVALLAAGYRTGGRLGVVVPLLALVVMGGVLEAGVQAVERVNRHRYGAGLVSDLADGEYVRTYGLWQSVDAGTDRRYVPVSGAQRTAVYSVSPAARELQTALEGSLLRNYSALSCDLVQVCDDYTVGFFPYALRDAMAQTGHETSAREAQSFLRALGDQIEATCSSHLLRCGARPHGLLPRGALSSPARLGSSGWGGAGYLLSFGLGDQDRPPSSGSIDSWRHFTRLAGVAGSPAAQQSQEQGTLHRAQALEAVRWVYSGLAVVALPLALTGYALALRRRRPRLLTVAFGLVAALTVLVRLALLAVVDATSFPATHNGYVLPASAPLCLALVLGVWCLWERRWGTTRESA
jgi:hypothetical protein